MRSPVIMYASNRCFLLGSATTAGLFVPFAVGMCEESFDFWPCGDCEQLFDDVCTGLLIIVGMRDLRHDGSVEATRWQLPCNFDEYVDVGDGGRDAFRSQSGMSA